MWQLIKFELYKIFSRKGFIVISILLLIILITANAFSIQNFLNGNGNPETLYQNFYKGNEGEISLSLRKEANDFFNHDSDKHDEFNGYKSKFNINDEETLRGVCTYFSDVNNSVNFSIGLKNSTKKVSNDAKEKFKTFGAQSYEYKYAKLHADLLSAQKPTGIYYDKMWFYPGQNLIYLIVPILVLLAITPVFCSETKLRTDSLILTSKKGKTHIVSAKIIAAAIMGVAISLFFNIANLLSFGLVLGFRGFDAVHPYKDLALNGEFVDQIFQFTNLEHFLLMAAFTTLGAVFLSVLVLLVSSLFNSSLLTFFISGAIYLLPIIYSYISSNLNLSSKVNHFFDVVNSFSYFNIFDGQSFFQSFKAYNIFGTPVLSVIVVPASFLILSSILIILIFRVWKTLKVS